MNLHEIYTDPHLLLPKSVPSNITFRKYMEEIFEEYLNLLRKVNPTTNKIIGMTTPINLTGVIGIQEKFIEGILESIKIYFDGQPANAYKKFEEVLEYRKSKYNKILNINEFDIDENFYRIRIKEENFPLTSSEMFHIPFSLRGKVSTQRYSIPGFPSLYLGKTLYVAWEELNRPSLDKFQAVRLITKNKVKYLDLTTSDWGTNNLNKHAYKYLMTWPLIAACSIKVKDYTDTFKPEYIVPQLLLQWIRNSGDIDGIKYDSTHVDKIKLKSDGELYNLVLPVKENKDKGLCKHLVALFEMTETISNQLLEYSSGGQTFLHSKAEFDKIDKKIPSLEIIKGIKHPYSFSSLGHMELILDGMKTKKIV